MEDTRREKGPYLFREPLSRRLVGRVMGLTLGALLAVAGASAGSDVLGGIHLTGDPEPTVHYYRMTSEVISIAPDGQRAKPDVYDLWLEYAPRPGTPGDLVTCRRLAVRLGEKPPAALPALRDWQYTFRLTPSGLDERGFIFGIDHARFEGLKDASGEALPVPVTYAAYNTLIDFHSFGQIFARRTTEGGGIQDLHAVGQKVLHAAANTEPPTSLGTQVEAGSFFRNGAVTLELKGLSAVGGRRCALVGFDSGDSAFKMILKPAPQIAIETNGGSHYMGDLYVDLETQWLVKATLAEFVVSETGGAVLPQKVQSVIERRLLLRSVTKDEFESSLK